MPDSNQYDLPTAIAENFENSTRDELLAYAEQMELNVHKNSNNATLRKMLLEKLGKDPDAPKKGVEQIEGRQVQVDEEEEERRDPIEYADEFPLKVFAPDPNDPDADRMPKKDLIRLMKLNLRPRGIWQGRRHLIQITKPDGMKGQHPHPVQWAGMQIMIPWSKAVSVPEPHYNILRDANYLELEQEEAKTKKGAPYMINHYTLQNRFRLSDMGIDPKTAHLPASQQEQFRIVAQNTNMLKEFNRVALAKLARRLRVKYPRDLEDEEIRMRLLEKLGYDLEMFGDDDFGGAI